ncbi:MAG: M28 family peptidase [Ignavibacteriales bacterium]|nr:M28 family peptidase [Ignavibacteriales bacterium]
MPGQKKAAQYIAGVFKKHGLKPLGKDGSYFQPFEVEVIRSSQESNIAVTTKDSRRTFVWLNDYVAFGAPDSSVGGPAVFVGYIDFKPDSATAARIKGRVVIALAGSRSGPRDTSDQGARRRFFAFRRDEGSLGTLVVGDPAGGSSFARIAPAIRGFVEKGQMRLQGSQGRGGMQFRSFYFTVSNDMAEAILSSSGHTLSALRAAAAESTFKPIFLDNATVSITHKLVRELRQSENVIGMIEGSDPELRQEYVFFTGHYDHLGKTNDGVIYHGADDDGSGTSMVLELAQAFAANPVKPKRSLVFLTVAGEEKGLLGSDYYTKNPIVPLEKTVVDLNTDMIGRTDPKHDSLKSGPYVYVIGSDKISTELDQTLGEANRETENIAFDYQFNDEHDPNQFYRRSDHYNFAKNGIPIAFFFTGEHKDYHKPTDTIEKILFDRMIKIGHVVYYAGWKTANRPTMFKKDGEGGGYK